MPRHALERFVDLASLATGGTGTTGDPWTGWATGVSADRAYFVPNGIFAGANVAVPNRAVFIGPGTFRKNANGPVFTLSGGVTKVWFLGPRIDGAGASFTGGGITVGGSTFFRFIGGEIIDCAGPCLDYSGAADNGHSSVVADSLLTIYLGQSGQANATVPAIKLPLDSGAPNRHFINLHFNACRMFEDAGSNDTKFTTCTGRDFTFTAAPTKFAMSGGCRVASAGATLTFIGTQNAIIGNIFAGPVVVGGGTAQDGAYVGNTIAGTLTFASGTTGNTAAGNSVQNVVIDNGSNIVDGQEWGFPYTVPIGVNSATLTGTANRAIYARVHERGVITKMGLQIGTSSGNICVAVYRKSGAGQLAAPLTRVATSGSVACPAAGYAEVSLGGTVEVFPGDYFALAVDNTTATILCTNASAAFSDLAKGISYLQETAFPLPAEATPSAARVPVPHLVGVV